MSDSLLFVGNLPFQARDEELREYFSAAGAIGSTNVIVDKVTGRSRGFAFVEMASPDEAYKAVELFDGKPFQGRDLNVTVARPSEDRPPRRTGGRD